MLDMITVLDGESFFEQVCAQCAAMSMFFLWNNDHLDLRRTSLGPTGGWESSTRAVCLLGCEDSSFTTSLRSLKSLLSLRLESFVAELSVHESVRGPEVLMRAHLRVDASEVLELRENISSGSMFCQFSIKSIELCAYLLP
jgi:hypothetical protein